MGFAKHAATKSKDSTQVGAILVGEDEEVCLTAYNGPPRGVHDLPERRDRPAKYLFASHAEANLVAFAARKGISTKGGTVYCTHYPCASCARTLSRESASQGILRSRGAEMWVVEFVDASAFRQPRSQLLWTFFNEFDTQDEALRAAEDFRKKSKFNIKTKVFLRKPRADLDG
jgi:dCMP deaminase